MPTYAVKLGEMQLRSDRPISPAEREAVIKLLVEAADEMLVDIGAGLQLEFLPGI